MTKENDRIYLTVPARNVRIVGDMAQIDMDMTGKELLQFIMRYVSGDESVGVVYKQEEKTDD